MNCTRKIPSFKNAPLKSMKLWSDSDWKKDSWAVCGPDTQDWRGQSELPPITNLKLDPTPSNDSPQFKLDPTPSNDSPQFKLDPTPSNDPPQSCL